MIEKYVPKKLHEAIKEIEKTDCYEVILNDGWLFDNNNTMFISYTVKELKEDLKHVTKVSMNEWNEIAFPKK